MAREIDKTLKDLVALQGLGSDEEPADSDVSSGTGLESVAGASAPPAEARREAGADPAADASGAQLREWKHQLASQAEVLRRDGVKILAREKKARAEREKIREARAAVEEQYKQLQALERQLTAEREAHDARQKKCQELQAQCDHWRGEVAQAQAALAEIARQPAGAQEASQEERLRETKQRELIERLEGRVGELLGTMDRKEREVGATAALVAQLQRELEQTRSAMERAQQEAQRVRVGAGVAEGQSATDDAGRQVYALQRELGDLQRERDAVKAKLGDLIEHVRRQEDGTLTQRRALEAEVAEMRTRCDRLLKEKDAWEDQRAQSGANQGDDEVGHELIDEAQAAGEREGLDRQRQELDAKAEQLENVQRMLERHELEWGRKISEHGAIKTVALAGIYVVLAATAAFAGAYAWVRPVYMGEATVQVAVGPGGERSLNSFLNRNAQAIRQNRLLVETAWAKMRQRGYADDDTRDGWVESLGGKDAAAGRLTLRGDQAGRTLTLRYTGPTPDGVATACNALAETLVDSPGSTDGDGVGAIHVAAPSVAPLRPMEDRRLIIGLEGAAGLIGGGALIAAAAAWRKRRQRVEGPDDAI